MRPASIPPFLVLLIGSSAMSQSPIAEDALRQSGAVVSYVDVDSAVKTDSAHPAHAAVPARAVVAPAAVDDEEDEFRPKRRFRILAGVTDWHWEEGIESRIILAEGGMMPGIRLEFARLFHSFELGSTLDFSYGAIEYDGGIQYEDGTIEDLKSNTHYSIFGIECFVVAPRFMEFLNVRTKGFTIEPGLKYGFQTWVRTIGSRKYKKPGDHGYVETWNMGAFQPVIALRVPFGEDRSYARLEAGVRFPIGKANNELSDFVSDGTTYDMTALVHPKPKPGYRVQGLVALGHVLFELEYLAQNFDKSNINSGLYQPDSYLDRLDARIGLEF